MTPTILTCDGTYFDLTQPDRYPINVGMVAHALSHLCRFTGHCREFYSVAQHAVFVSYLVPPELAYDALHHDDAEAFIGDVASPLKHLIPDYRRIEEGVEAEVFRQMGLPAELDPLVKQADLKALRTEQRDLMSPMGGLWTSLAGVQPCADIRVVPVSPRTARDMYLDRHFELLARRGASCSHQSPPAWCWCSSENLRPRGCMAVADPQPYEQCRRRGGCVCGGDLPSVRAGCSQWKGDQ